MIRKYFRKMYGRFSGYIIEGERICPHCGGTNVIPRGFEGHNRRHDCLDCGAITEVRPAPRGFHTVFFTTLFGGVLRIIPSST